MTAPRPNSGVPVAVLVLNWNGRALTEACVSSWLRARPRPKRLLVVDNGSTDGSVPYLRKRFKGLEILALPSNLGFAAGNNRGLEALRKRGPKVEAVFICNNDTEVEPDMLGLLWRALEARPQWGAAGPRILIHGTRRVWFDGALIRPLTGRSMHLAYGAPAGPAGEPFQLPPHGFVTGCGMLVRGAALEDLGGFDEGLWAYGEDSDLCLRLRERGLASGMVPRARMSHKVSSTFVQGSPLKEYYDTRNSYALMRRHRLGYGALTRGAFVCVGLARAGRALAKGSPAAAMAIVKGLSDGVRGRFPLFGSRP